MPVFRPGIQPVIAVLAMLAVPSVRLPAQSVDDGMMVSRGAVMTGVMYSHDRWDKYWEGELKRDNGNIGTLTTQSASWLLGYGVSDRLSLLATLPYVWTHSSAPPSHGFRGMQDLTIAAKYQLLRVGVKQPGTFNVGAQERGNFTTFLVGTAGTPLSDYTPDFLPFSIGLASRSLSGRLTMNYLSRSWWFVNGSGARTWRGNVKLDRSSYYTQGRLYLTNQVVMPDVFDYTLSAGYQRGRWCVPLFVSQQRTLGGGDIRRQDMPFVSNKMDFVKAGAMAMYTLPAPTHLAIHVGASRVLDGRNVGQSTVFTAGLTRAFHP